MSVHGEFDRYLRDLLGVLRETDRPEFLTWADSLEPLSDAHDQPLEFRARSILDGPLGQQDSECEGFPRIGELIDDLLAIARIILGR